MNSVLLHSILPANSGTSPGQWRIASALVRVAVAELEVSREESLEVSEDRVLILETIRLLENETGTAVSSGITELSGIGDPGLTASILATMVQEGLVIVDGDTVRCYPGLAIEGGRAKIVVDRDERVVVVDSPPVPCPRVDPRRVESLATVDANLLAAPVSDNDLERWRMAFWDDATRRLRLKTPLQSRLHVLEGGYDGSLMLGDERQTLRLNLPQDHPLARRMADEACRVREAAGPLLRRFGRWDPECCELHCNQDELRRWWAANGRDETEVTLRGDVDVGLRLRCRPADADAAWTMFLQMVVDALDATPGALSEVEISGAASEVRLSSPLHGRDLPIPTMAELEIVAWESGHWELAYRMARAADGL